DSDIRLCSHCKVRRRARKRLQISRLPDILLIHLKRFSFQGPFRNKIENLVRFPLRYGSSHVWKDDFLKMLTRSDGDGVNQSCWPFLLRLRRMQGVGCDELPTSQWTKADDQCAKRCIVA